ncbi:hypothetical protein ACFLU3_03565 [Chloroflexota bacterium]
MKTLKKSLVFLLVVVMLVCACDSDSDSDSQPVPGKITAIASGVAGQDGKVLAVGAFDYDWKPGSSDFGIAGYRTQITGDSFSLSDVLRKLDDRGDNTDDEEVFDPGIYSVVFVISTVNTPPEYFVEVRVEVDGDVNATAPAWTDWEKL